LNIVFMCNHPTRGRSRRGD